MNLSEKIFQWFVSHHLENTEISLENRMRIDRYKNGSLDYNEDKAIDFFIKRIAGLSTKEIIDTHARQEHTFEYK